jgi:hydrogenase expression/formation protein HypD
VRGAARTLVDRIRNVADGLPHVTLMEVCGTHTTAIHRAGIRGLLPDGVRLISGPGCPVCVTPVGVVDTALALARKPDVVVFTFGDLLRVPGSTSSLEQERARGADVRIVLSPLDALRAAEGLPDRLSVFLAVGFETTSPTIAVTVVEARRRGLDRFLVLAANRVMPPPMRALAADPEMRVDGFLCPGHVSAITGAAPFRFLAEEHGKACVIGGFEPTDVLRSVLLLLEQIRDGRPDVAIQYDRVVRPDGNPRARRVVEEVFRPVDAAWRGLGTLPESGLALREAFADHDAEARLDVVVEPPVEPSGCRCGEVLRGRLEPPDCPLFGETCTPEAPVGACMVSSEGACAAAFRYGALA